MHSNELVSDHQFQQLVKQFATGCKFHVSFCFVVIDVPPKQFNNHSRIIYPTTRDAAVWLSPVWRGISLNLELDFGSGSQIFLNPEPDLKRTRPKVRFRFREGLDLNRTER